MDRADAAEALLHVAAAFAIAVMLTPLVRSVTVGLDDTVGQLWPFSLTRCHIQATPGCQTSLPALGLQARR